MSSNETRTDIVESWVEDLLQRRLSIFESWTDEESCAVDESTSPSSCHRQSWDRTNRRTARCRERAREEENSTNKEPAIDSVPKKTKKKKDSSKLNKFLKKIGVEDQKKEKPKFEIDQ